MFFITNATIIDYNFFLPVIIFSGKKKWSENGNFNTALHLLYLKVAVVWF